MFKTTKKATFSSWERVNVIKIVGASPFNYISVMVLITIPLYVFRQYDDDVKKNCGTRKTLTLQEKKVLLVYWMLNDIILLLNLLN